MKIYVILSGEYSDWYIQGFVYKEDEATKVCANHNKQYPNDDWYYMEVKQINDIPNETLVYEQEVVFDKKGNSWFMRNEPNRHEYKSYKGGKLPKSKISVYPINRDIITAHIWQLKLDRKKAEKIAQDMLAKFLAEQNGI